MIIILICIAFALIAIALKVINCIIEARTNKAYAQWVSVAHDKTSDTATYKTALNNYDKCKDVSNRIGFDNDFIRALTAACTIIAITCAVIIIPVLCIQHSPQYIQHTTQKMIMQKECLEYRLSTQQEIGNEYLYNDILSYNEKVYEYQYAYNNPWVSWFNSKQLANFEYIDYTQIKK